MADDEGHLRKQALDSLKRKRDFKNFILVYVVVNAVVVAVWALTGQGYFWPAWVLFGMTMALVFGWWNAYGGGSKPITQKDIDEEMQRFKE